MKTSQGSVSNKRMVIFCVFLKISYSWVMLSILTVYTRSQIWTNPKQKFAIGFYYQPLTTLHPPGLFHLRHYWAFIRPWVYLNYLSPYSQTYQNLKPEWGWYQSISFGVRYIQWQHQILIVAILMTHPSYLFNPH